jgi:hypothetical protein
VAYRGGAPAVADVAAGRINLMFANIAEVVELIRGGQVRGLALAAATPTPLAPEMPLLTRDFPALDMSNWFGLVGPAGMGANHQGDGIACLSWPSNVSSTSIEVSEHIAPLRFHHKKLREESGGPGARRDGMGQDILIEVRSPTPIAVSFLAERTVIPAFGVEGGGAGSTGALHINGEKVDPKRQYVLRAGETIQLSTPGGGGHGAA